MQPTDSQFNDLKRLLALKRHEQPPPGYFERLPVTILRRIRIEHQTAPFDGWLTSLVDRLTFRPALAGVCGVGLCVLYLAGLGIGRSTPPLIPQAAFLPPARDSAFPIVMANRHPSLQGNLASGSIRASSGLSSVSPVLSPFYSPRCVAIDRLPDHRNAARNAVFTVRDP